MYRTVCCKSLAKWLMFIYTITERLMIYMSNIKLVSDIGNIALIDMMELDDIENELALYKFKYEMAMAEKSIREDGTISADDLEKDLGV